MYSAEFLRMYSDSRAIGYLVKLMVAVGQGSTSMTFFVATSDLAPHVPVIVMMYSPGG